MSTSLDWTPEQDRVLMDLHENERKSFSAIGSIVGRSAQACFNRYYRIYTRPPVDPTKAKEIPCLQCRQAFYSPDFKRIKRCPRCHSNTDESAGIFVMGAGFAGYATRARRVA